MRNVKKNVKESVKSVKSVNVDQQMKVFQTRHLIDYLSFQIKFQFFFLPFFIKLNENYEIVNIFI